MSLLSTLAICSTSTRATSIVRNARHELLAGQARSVLVGHGRRRILPGDHAARGQHPDPRKTPTAWRTADGGACGCERAGEGERVFNRVRRATHVPTHERSNGSESQPPPAANRKSWLKNAPSRRVRSASKAGPGYLRTRSPASTRANVRAVAKSSIPPPRSKAGNVRPDASVHDNGGGKIRMRATVARPHPGHASRTGRRNSEPSQRAWRTREAPAAIVAPNS